MEELCQHREPSFHRTFYVCKKRHCLCGKLQLLTCSHGLLHVLAAVAVIAAVIATLVLGATL